jgi:hypothetical protein
MFYRTSPWIAKCLTVEDPTMILTLFISSAIYLGFITTSG